MGRILSNSDRDSVWSDNRSSRCGICGKKVDPDNWDCDHVVPYAKGGETSTENSQVTHPICNKTKGSKYQRRDGGPLIFRGIGQDFSHDPY